LLAGLLTIAVFNKVRTERGSQGEAPSWFYISFCPLKAEMCNNLLTELLAGLG
jgi:hypothetical protein